MSNSGIVVGAGDASVFINCRLFKNFQFFCTLLNTKVDVKNVPFGSVGAKLKF